MAHYTPITELPNLSNFADSIKTKGEFTMDSPMVTWDIELPPYINADRIELNMSRIERMHQLGSFAASFVTEYQGQKTREEPTIAGMNGDGTAMAGKRVTVTRGDLSKSNVQLVQGEEYLPNLLKASYGKATILHKLNSSEIEQNIANQRPTSKTRDGIWARELARGLGDSYRHSASEHLMNRVSAQSKALDLSVDALIASVATINVMTNSIPSILIGAGAGTAMAIGLQQYIANKFDLSLRDRRWSMLSILFQPEAYVAVNALSRMPGLLRLRPESKE